MSEELVKEIINNFNETGVSYNSKYRMCVQTPKEELFKLLKYLKEKGFNYLVMITCVDWINENKFELVYQIGSFTTPLRIIIQTRVPRDNPVYKSIIPIFKNATDYEREIHELFGIKFEGNPRLTPLFLDDWQKFHPFKKDFNSREYVKNIFDSIPTLEEYK